MKTPQCAFSCRMGLSWSLPNPLPTPNFTEKVFFSGRSNLCRAKQEAVPLSPSLCQYANKQSVRLICLQIILTVWSLTACCQLNSFTLFQLHKRRLYTWTSPDSQYQNQIDYIFAVKDGEALYSQQKQDRELTGSDHELLIAEFRLKLKKVGKTTKPFMYDLNQIPYNYTVQVTNRFKGLDLIDNV